MRTVETIQSIYNSIPVASIIMLPDHPTYTIRIVNESFVRETNSSREQLIGKGFFEAFSINPDDTGVRTANITNAFEQVLSSKSVQHIRGHRYDLPSSGEQDLEVRYWDIDTYPLLDEAGEVEYIVQGSVNVTARLLAELKLERSNKKLNKILSSITDGFFILDKNHLVSYWNTAAEAISRRSTEQVIGRSIWDIYPKAMLSDLREAYQKAEKEQIQVQIEQYNPEVSRWYEITLQPSEEGVFVYFKDISYRKETERRAQEALQRNYDLFNFSPVPMWAYHTGTLQMVASNQAAQVEYEYSAQEFLELTARDVWAEKECPRMDELIETTIRCGLPNEGFVKHVTKSGKELDVQMKSQPLPTWGEDIRIVMALDITHQKRVEKDLHTSNERYAYVNKATNDAIYDWDIVKNHVEWGAAFSRLFGHPISGEHYPVCQWKALIHPKDIRRIEQSLSEALDDPAQTNWKAEYSFCKANGEYARIEENGYILKDDQGRSIRMIGVLKDISERKASAEALQAAKNRYMDVFELSPQPMWVYELDSLRFLDVNAAAIQNYGYSKAEFLEMTLLDIRPAQDIETLKHVVKEEVRNGMPHSSFFQHRKKNGEIIKVLIRGNSLNYEGKNARIVIAIDDTARIKAEEALRCSERRFKTLIQDGSDLITIINSNGDFKYVSPTAVKVLGIAPDALLPINVFDLIHDDDREKVTAQVSHLPDAEGISLPAFRLIRPDGAVRWMEVILTNMESDPAVQGIVCNARDVTERFEHELKIREHLERYNIVSKATSDAIWDLQIQTDELTWNYGITEIFGHEETTRNYMWWYDRVHPEDLSRVTEVVQTSVREKEPRWSCEYRFRCADDSYKFVLDRGFLMFDETGAPLRMIGAMEDITERVNYIHEIERHNSLMREIGWAQAHLVRGPMARILGLLELLTQPQNEEGCNMELLKFLNTSAHELDEVIRRIIRKSESGPEL
jgi:PAS domain S-box-containing protein